MGGGGVLTGDDIRGCTKASGCFFVIFGISMGRYLSQTQCAQFAKLDVFWKMWPKKHPNCSKLGVFLWQFCIVMGLSRGIQVVEILKSTLSIPVQNFLKNLPGQ